MARRALDLATLISAILLAITLLLALATLWLNPWDHRVSLRDGFHVAVEGRGLDIRVVFFNNAEYGPYSGSVIGFGDPWFPRKTGFGDAWGVYYRHFRRPDGGILWTLRVSLW